MGHKYNHIRVYKNKNDSSFFNPQLRHTESHGGELRKKRAGRGRRPLSTKCPLHLVFKLDANKMRNRSLRGFHEFRLVNFILKKYARHFAVKVEQLSIQSNHIHILIRFSHRSHIQNFLRVCSGQIAQQLEKQKLLINQTMVTDTPKSQKSYENRKKGKLWLLRPFSRVVKGFWAYRIIRNYIQLNEFEVVGRIKYQPNRLRGRSMDFWEGLWFTLSNAKKIGGARGAKNIGMKLVIARNSGSQGKQRCSLAPG